MKKIIATTCLLVSTVALSACDTVGSGNVDREPPYAMERTASHQQEEVYVEPVRAAPAERIFQRAQTK